MLRVNQLTMGARSLGGLYTIEHSLDLGAGNNYLSRTNSLGNTDKYSISFWVKTTDSGAYVFEAGASSYCYWGGDVLGIYWTPFAGATALSRTDQESFDDGNWHHICAHWDTAQVTAADRKYMAFDGTEVTWDLENDTIAQNANTDAFNGSGNIVWGAGSAGASGIDALIADLYTIEDQALVASDFGYDDGGTWRPKAFEGTYGSLDSFYNFSNVAALGEDQSGQGNDATENGTLSRSTDTPTS